MSQRRRTPRGEPPATPLADVHKRLLRIHYGSHLVFAPLATPLPVDVMVVETGPLVSATLSKGLELFPSLMATSGGIGGQLVVELENGDIGFYILGFGLQKLAAPTAFPGTWYGLLIDKSGLTVILESGVFAQPDEITTSFPIPANPSLTGLPIYLQAFCQQGFLASTTSFTNLFKVQI